jgi:hypothetical protein
MSTDRGGEIVEPGAPHSADAALSGGGVTRLDRVRHHEWQEQDRYHPPRDATDNAAHWVASVPEMCSMKGK